VIIAAGVALIQERVHEQQVTVMTCKLRWLSP